MFYLAGKLDFFDIRMKYIVRFHTASQNVLFLFIFYSYFKVVYGIMLVIQNYNFLSIFEI